MKMGKRLKTGAISKMALAAVLACPLTVRAADPPKFPQTLAQAIEAEKRNEMPPTGFYDQPVALEAGRAGALLARESVTGYALPPGTGATRILYQSLQGGKDAVISGVVLTPAGTPPAGGWPVIAWAHGTSGMARQCAPSAMKDVYYGAKGLTDMLAAGFAIVATDYYGLGAPGAHPYMNKADHAEDIINALPAAQAAVPALGKKWVVSGHSQGGLAAWGVAEALRVKPDENYLGAVSIAAATHLGWFLDHPEATKGAGFYLGWHAYGVAQRYPGDFKPADMLSQTGQSHYKDITENGCLYYAALTYAGVEAPQMLKPEWRENGPVRKFFLENSAGETPIAGPILVIAGEGDNAVPVEATRDAVKKACALKPELEYRSFAGLDHLAAMTKTTSVQIDWIKDRFAGKAAPSNCEG